MINSVKIDNTLQKRIFCQKNDLIKSSPIQLLKITIFKNKLPCGKFLQYFGIHVHCCLIPLTSFSTIVQDILYLYLVKLIYKLPRMLLILHCRDLNFLKYGHKNVCILVLFIILKLPTYIVCVFSIILFCVCFFCKTPPFCV